MIETIFRAIIITLIITIVLGVLGSIAINYNLSLSPYISILQNFLSVVFYIFPFNKLKPIFIAIIGFSVYKIAISILKTIWNILPIRG